MKGSATRQHGGDSDSPSWLGSLEDVAHLNADPGIQELNNAMIRAWYQTLTGRGCDCN